MTGDKGKKVTNFLFHFFDTSNIQIERASEELSNDVSTIEIRVKIKKLFRFPNLYGLKYGKIFWVGVTEMGQWDGEIFLFPCK